MVAEKILDEQEELFRDLRNRLGAKQHAGVHNDRCNNKKKEVFVYDLLELIAVDDFYKIIANNPELMAFVPLNQPVGKYHINKARRDYFGKKGITVPQEATDDYQTFLTEYPENRFFDYLVTEKDIVHSHCKVGQEIIPPEEVEMRRKRVILERYYLAINCCDVHQEEAIAQAVDTNWHRRQLSPAKDGPVDRQVYNNSLIYAPGRKQGEKVILTVDVATKLSDRANQVKDLFYELVTSK